ncbi:MAG: manganese efflux pump [Clostridia bacterium]|nr:manganese efflux pump [Clostridia bacterium]MBR6780763.1 manganese efflux pump [Clostridia bacterium]
MGLWEVFLIGVGLAMDAFSVAVCKGLTMPKIDKKQTAVIALFFGGFQALMPFLGWALGKQFESYITAVDHWIAFILLGVIGGKMIYDVIKNNGKEEECCTCGKLDLKELFTMAVATSIDALATGITFAFLKVNILSAISVIGITTFILAVIGVLLGHKFGAKWKDKASLAGGIVLILLGTKILLEHLGIFSF